MTNEESIKPDSNGMTPERICELYCALIAWGADISHARERFLEDDELYIRCLRRFADGSFFVRLDKALQSHDGAGAYEAAHVIKGTTGTLNLKPLYDIVCKITQGLRGQGWYEELEADYQELCECYAQFCSMI